MSLKAQWARWDAELAVMARGEGALRLRLGRVLEALGRRGLCFELGFSSLSAYALERCERSARWVEGARTMARRLEVLPQLRSALAQGSISWSQAELVVRVASPADEAEWLKKAQSCTVRGLQGLLKGAGVECREASCAIHCTVDREEAWLFKATRTLLAQLGVQDRSEQIEALLAEGQSTLLAALPRGAIDPELLDPDVLERISGVSVQGQAELARLGSEAGERREERYRRNAIPAGQNDSFVPGENGRHTSLLDAETRAGVCDAAMLEGESARQLDARVRQLAQELACRELELAQRVLQFHRACCWRGLGYATEAEWARASLGLSLASVTARRALAVRLESLPLIGVALGRAQIGIEAALQLVRVATPATEQAWLERAQCRTIKHLREEIAAALVAMRISGSTDCWPPIESELESFMDLESAVVSGRLWERSVSGAELPAVRRWRSLVSEESESRRAWWLMLSSLEQWLDAALQMSAAPPGTFESLTAGAAGLQSRGRIGLRLTVSRSTAAWWRTLEAQACRWLPQGLRWLKFLCQSFWQAWGPSARAARAYGQIYVRDRFCCTSPVCCRRDVTPHHLQFRSAGGSDADDNVAAVCTWCHLFGIHGGRIRARGTAERIRWEFGAPGQPCLVVNGRERLAA